MAKLIKTCKKPTIIFGINWQAGLSIILLSFSPKIKALLKMESSEIQDKKAWNALLTSFSHNTNETSVYRASNEATCQTACCCSCLMPWIYSWWEVEHFFWKYECSKFPPIQLVRCRTKSNDKRWMGTFFFLITLESALYFQMHWHRNWDNRAETGEYEEIQYTVKDRKKLL